MNAYPHHIAGPAIALGILVAVIATPPTTWAGTSGSVEVILAASAKAEIRIHESAVVLVPDDDDLAVDHVAAEGIDGIEAEIRSNCATGTALNVRLDGGANDLAASDLWFRTRTPVRDAGVSQQIYTPVRSSDQLVWSSSGSLPEWTAVHTDIRLHNLHQYVTSLRAARSLSSTLIFTVVTQ